MEILVFQTTFKILANRGSSVVVIADNGRFKGQHREIAMSSFMDMIQSHEDAKEAGTLDDIIEMRRKADERRKTHFKNLYY